MVSIISHLTSKNPHIVIKSYTLYFTWISIHCYITDLGQDFEIEPSDIEGDEGRRLVFTCVPPEGYPVPMVSKYKCYSPLSIRNWPRKKKIVLDWGQNWWWNSCNALFSSITGYLET